MLILSRKKNESIVINGNIEISIIGIEEGKVKIGIEAPKDVQILRSEVLHRIEADNKEALVGLERISQLSELLKK